MKMGCDDPKFYAELLERAYQFAAQEGTRVTVTIDVQSELDVLPAIMRRHKSTKVRKARA